MLQIYPEILPDAHTTTGYFAPDPGTIIFFAVSGLTSYADRCLSTDCAE